MKRTTYIFIGLLVSGLMVIVATIIFISMSGKPYREDVNFGGDEQVTMDLNGDTCCKGVCQSGRSARRETCVCKWRNENRIHFYFGREGTNFVS